MPLYKITIAFWPWTKAIEIMEELTVGRAIVLSVWLSLLSIVTTISSCINLSILGFGVLMNIFDEYGCRKPAFKRWKSWSLSPPMRIMCCPAIMTPLDFYIQSLLSRSADLRLTCSLAMALTIKPVFEFYNSFLYLKNWRKSVIRIQKVKYSRDFFPRTKWSNSSEP